MRKSEIKQLLKQLKTAIEIDSCTLNVEEQKTLKLKIDELENIIEKTYGQRN